LVVLVPVMLFSHISANGYDIYKMRVGFDWYHKSNISFNYLRDLEIKYLV